MELTKKAKNELENRLERIEKFINEKGLGSQYLTKAKKAQRNINLAIFFGSVLTVAGIAAWILTSSDDEE
ncbi:MAG: hypothetical protein R3345_11375 [Fulvivirga sp.]|nr:hypothetical protein [Fulvivirga sp.]